MPSLPLFLIGQKVETVADTRAIGGRQYCHVNFGTVERLTPSLIIVRNEHGNLQRHYIPSGASVGADKLTPSRIIPVV